MIEERDKLIEELIKAETHECECWQKAFLSENDRMIYQESYIRIFEIQRQILALENTEYCEHFDFPYQWYTRVPFPHLLQNDNKTILIYYLNELKDKIHDGKTIEVINPATTVYLITIVEFRSWHASLGIPHNDGLQGCHLLGKGLNYYTPQSCEILNK